MFDLKISVWFHNHSAGLLLTDSTVRLLIKALNTYFRNYYRFCEEIIVNIFPLHNLLKAFFLLVTIIYLV